MSRLDFGSLASKVRSIDPYRGTMRYPMDNRSNRQNIFELVEKDNDIEFHVSHGYRYNSVEISEARYKLMEGVRGAKVNKKTHEYEPFEYYTTEITPRVLCVVRSDNSIEYVADSFYQGDNMKMSDWMFGYQYDSYKMSGTAWNGAHHKGTNINHPIFKGLRIDLETHQPVNQNVQVFRRTVNRSKSKELMAIYKEAFKTPDAMLKCMDIDTLMVSLKDIVDEANTDGHNNYFASAEKALANKENFDAVVLYAMSMGLDGFNSWAISNHVAGTTQRYHRTIDPQTIVSRLVASMSKKLYKEHKPFDEEEVSFLNVAPCQWGLRIVVDGVEVNL